MPDAPGRLAVDAERDRRRPRRGRCGSTERVEHVAAVHLRVDEPDRAHQRVDECRAAATSSRRSTPRCRWPPRCPSTSASGAGAGRGVEPGAGVPSVRASAVTAIASLSVDAAGNVARAFQAAPAPVVEILDVDPAVLPKRCASRRTVRWSSGSLRGARSAGVARRRRRARAARSARLRRPCASTVIDSTVASRGGRSTRSWKCRLRERLAASVREPTRTITRRVPGAAVPRRRRRRPGTPPAARSPEAVAVR